VGLNRQDSRLAEQLGHSGKQGSNWYIGSTMPMIGIMYWLWIVAKMTLLLERRILLRSIRQYHFVTRNVAKTKLPSHAVTQ
jgi:hypothetical protein